MLVIVSIVFLVIFLLALIGLGRIVWRVVHDNEEAVPGGSLGRQFLGRHKDESS